MLARHIFKGERLTPAFTPTETRFKYRVFCYMCAGCAGCVPGSKGYPARLKPMPSLASSHLCQLCRVKP